ncbi:MAG: NAD-dependent epimerase/dehydratase family protein [Armatimonadota bacterium]|nr:NAD-dependent epimerase/dehydratase family protein [Armatimonadota bacterium]
MTTLVTGGAGVVGSYVVRDLVARGERPLVVDTAIPDAWDQEFGGRVDVERTDIRDLDRLVALFGRYRVRTVLHLAALTGAASDDEPLVMFGVNMTGTMHVLEAARRTGARRVVMASTRTVYPDFDGTPYGHPTYRRVPEDHWLDPDRPYEIWKHAAERMGRFYTRKFGLECSAFRFAIYYAAERTLNPGSRAMGVLHAMMAHAVRGAPLVLAGGAERVMDCIYVRDLARAFILAADAAALPSAAYNIGAGEPVTPARFAAAVTAAVPDARIEVGPGIDFAPGHYCVLDISRARRELGFAPQWTLEAGVADCVARARALGLRAGTPAAGGSSWPPSW